jgi:hypothetical protein
MNLLVRYLADFNRDYCNPQYRGRTLREALIMLVALAALALLIWWAFSLPDGLAVMPDTFIK